MGKLIAIPSITIAVFLASPAHAELRTLPGGTMQLAVTRIGCSVVIDGQELMNGTCHHRLTKSADVFMTLPEATTQITVNVSRRGDEGRMVRLWMWTLDGKQRDEILGRLRVQPDCHRTEWAIVCSCWANERVRICSWPLKTPDESPPRSSGEAYSFPPPKPPAPPSPNEQHLDELTEPR